MMAAISAATSSLLLTPEPKPVDRLASTSSNTVNSRSSTYFFTWSEPEREVTFQSMVRISSPAW